MKDFERVKGPKVLLYRFKLEKICPYGLRNGWVFKNIRVWARGFKEMSLYEYGTNEIF